MAKCLLLCVTSKVYAVSWQPPRLCSEWTAVRFYAQPAASRGPATPLIATLSPCAYLRVFNLLTCDADLHAVCAAGELYDLLDMYESEAAEQRLAGMSSKELFMHVALQGERRGAGVGRRRREEAGRAG